MSRIDGVGLDARQPPRAHLRCAKALTHVSILGSCVGLFVERSRGHQEPHRLTNCLTTTVDDGDPVRPVPNLIAKGTTPSCRSTMTRRGFGTKMLSVQIRPSRQHEPAGQGRSPRWICRVLEIVGADLAQASALPAPAR